MAKSMRYHCIATEENISKNSKNLLRIAGFRSFEGVSRLKRGTFLKKVPKTTVRTLHYVERCMNNYGLAFVLDDTISSFQDSTISQGMLFCLWNYSNIKRYSEFENKWNVFRILGRRRVGPLVPQRKEDYAPCLDLWINQRGILFEDKSELKDVGFSEKTYSLMRLHGIDSWAKLEPLSEGEILEIIGISVRNSGPIIREIRYIFWKNKVYSPHRPAK